VRHGEVEGNSGERRTFSGWNDVVLTARGERQAHATAKRLEHENVRAVYSSDLQRAQHTAQTIAAPHTLPVQTDAALREVHYGAWAGLGEAELVTGWSELWRQRLNDAVNTAAPGGESLADLWRRLEPAWNAIVEQHTAMSEDAVVVAHNGPVRVLVCGVLGMPLENYRRIHIGNCSLTCVQLNKGKPPLVEFVNETCHLTDI
jgi:alpha-ribazole phosphatase